MKRTPYVLFLILFSASLVHAQDRWENYYRAGLRALEAGDLPKAELLLKASRLKAELEFEAGTARAIEMRLDSNNAIAVVLREVGKSAEAEQVLREQLDLLNTAGRSEDDSQVSTTFHNLGLALFDQRKFEQARKALERAVELRRKYDPEPQRNVAISLNSLGGTYFNQGKLREAETALLQARNILSEIPDAEKTRADLATVMRSDYNLALVLVEKKSYADAEAAYKRAINSMEKLFGPTSPGLVSYLTNYAKLLRILKRDAETRTVEARIETLKKQDQ